MRFVELVDLALPVEIRHERNSRVGFFGARGGRGVDGVGGIVDEEFEG